MGLDIFLCKKNLVRNFLGPKKIWSKKYLGLKKIGPNSFLYDLSVLCAAVLITADLNNKNTEFDGPKTLSLQLS